MGGGGVGGRNLNEVYWGKATASINKTALGSATVLFT